MHLFTTNKNYMYIYIYMTRKPFPIPLRMPLAFFLTDHLIKKNIFLFVSVFRWLFSCHSHFIKKKKKTKHKRKRKKERTKIQTQLSSPIRAERGEAWMGLIETLIYRSVSILHLCSSDHLCDHVIHHDPS